MKELTVKSPAFKNNKLIPTKYTCDGEEVSPPLAVEGIPKKTKSLALIMEDVDAPAGLFIHWLVWNISPTAKIQENSVPGTEGLNTNKTNAYHGPCPPGGTHRYYFKVYALDTHLNLGTLSDKEVLENAMENHILAHGELIGLYRRGQ